MSVWLQIVLGLLAGAFFGFFALSSQIKSAEKNILKIWINLSDALDNRYLKLKNLLLFLKKYMTDFHGEIDELNSVIDKTLDVDKTLKMVPLKLALENEVNYKLENIKSNMEKYPSLYDDQEINEAIIAVAESESSVGDEITLYNAVIFQFRILLESFPYSFSAWVLNKSPEEFSDFVVTSVEQLNEDYVSEEDINI